VCSPARAIFRIFRCFFIVHFVYFTTKWYIFWPFGTFCGHLAFFPILVCCTEKNLATLILSHSGPAASSSSLFPTAVNLTTPSLNFRSRINLQDGVLLFRRIETGRKEFILQKFIYSKHSVACQSNGMTFSIVHNKLRSALRRIYNLKFII
jgi:hypothetical protein